MKKQIVILFGILSLFIFLSPDVEATVTTGKIEYYYQSSSSIDDSPADGTPGSQTDSNSEVLTSGSGKNAGIPVSPQNQLGNPHSRVTSFLQTNDQRNSIFVIIGILIVAIAFLGWRIIINRRKNE